jgi:hypothetical protein
MSDICEHSIWRQYGWFETHPEGQVFVVSCNDCEAILFEGPIFTKYMKHNPVVNPSVADRLTTMNSFHGRGRVERIEFDRATMTGYVTCKLQYGTTRRKFTIKDSTLRFLGRQRKLLPCELM